MLTTSQFLTMWLLNSSHSDIFAFEVLHFHSIHTKDKNILNIIDLMRDIYFSSKEHLLSGLLYKACFKGKLTSISLIGSSQYPMTDEIIDDS